MNTLTNEPVVTAGTIAGLISAFIVFLRSMSWLPMTDDQFTAFMGFVVLATPIAMAFAARARVRPVAKMSGDEVAAMNATIAASKKMEVPQ